VHVFSCEKVSPRLFHVPVVSPTLELGQPADATFDGRQLPDLSGQAGTVTWLRNLLLHAVVAFPELAPYQLEDEGFAGHQ